MTRTLLGAVALVLYVNTVPFASRAWRGTEWAAQYLPGEDHLVVGLLFFGGFASLVAIPLIGAFALRRWIPVSFVLSVVLATALLVFWHHDYDLASDPQAAIGLVIIPLYVSCITGMLALLAGMIEHSIRRRAKEPASG